MIIIPGVNMSTWKITPFFHLLFELYSLVYFIFVFQNLQTQFRGIPYLHYFLVSKIHIYILTMTLSSLLTWISFSCIKFANFWYNMFCSKFDTNLAQVPWTVKLKFAFLPVNVVLVCFFSCLILKILYLLTYLFLPVK